ncbi:pyridoxamine 5'-phosphate oxidase [Flexithrix dorotheae]|uniref:pyridoxamine 5'-phosphate oxidase n=1 Tax=Flexithrix dorotheae TaxID=70993 RepID=UPI0003664282|nr:pyridoxamine 5'-phosphate oxidase [Flexithrix dorotheae]
MNVADIRKDYSLRELDILHVDKDPIVQFNNWMKEAIGSECLEPTAMVLSTVSSEGRPSSRVMLLKGVEEKSFVFYTNYNSRKGNAIKENAFVSLNFFWAELERQVRIEGKVEKVSASVSDEYFNSRPIGSRIGAHVSPQSQKIPDRLFLEDMVKTKTEEFKNKEVTRPEHWGGFRVNPDRIEFWQGRPSRLHDRILFELSPNGEWEISRLAP